MISSASFHSLMKYRCTLHLVNLQSKIFITTKPKGSLCNVRTYVRVCVMSPNICKFFNLFQVCSTLYAHKFYTEILSSNNSGIYNTNCSQTYRNLRADSEQGNLCQKGKRLQRKLEKYQDVYLDLAPTYIL